MLEQLLATDKPRFITLRDDSFVIDGTAYDQLSVQVQDLLAVRKFFVNGKIHCYSNDNRIGKDGQFCALCRQRYKCQPRIRLMLLLFRNKQPEPAILEINRSSVPPLQALIDENGIERLYEILLHLSVIILDNGRRAIDFTPVF